MEFHAESIMQHANFSFVLPNDVAMEEVFDLKYYDRDPMNLILLHGLTGTDTDWLYGGVAQLVAIQYNLNIFMPTTGNSFYLDQGYKDKAKEIYSKLSLRYPEKSAYFAALIEKID